MRVLRHTIEFANTVLGKIRAKQRISIPNNISSVRLNLGCGLAVAPGWINIDGSFNALVASMPAFFHKLFYRFTGAREFYSEEEYCSLLGENTFVHHELSKSIPVNDNQADFIFSSHFLEHLYQHQANHLVHECYRTLKKGGVVRISIPDLEYALSLYQDNKKERMLSDYFFVEDDENNYSRHKYMYDFDMLSTLLRDAGFQKISRCEFQQGSVPDIKILDNRPDESLFVEAVK